MVVTEANSKRPVCPSCSKPARICLCNRVQFPGLENSVRVTILQHSLEQKHPLNSARIARLGLKNLTVATVSDVNFEARFVIRLQEPDSETGSVRNGFDGLDFDEVGDNGETQKLDFEYGDGVGLISENVGNSEFGLFAKCPIEKNTNLVDTSGECSLRNDLSGMRNSQNPVASDALNIEYCVSENGTFAAASTLNEAVLDEGSIVTNDSIEVVQRGHKGPVITANIGKYGFISSLCHIWMLQTHLQKPNFSEIIASPAACDALAKGFSVKKFQKRQLSGSMELEEYVEFELEVPPGSVLLFPSDCAIGIDDLGALGFEVRNLIVLDGTWAKAKRMYNENPWLKLLPHLKLDLNKMNLYSEVRHQPEAGYLSTIESIVYALKAVGYNPEGLDNLLDVFESMVADQRRCKDERLSKVRSV